MEEKTFDRRKILLICIGVLILILLVAGVTYAYFQHQIGEPATGNVGVDTDTPDNLVFDVSNDINITITQFNFGPDDGNQSDSAVASASLTANSTNDTANYTYYVYFKINTNEYVYTTQDSQTEILLKVTAPTGQPVTSIEGLTYNSTLGGFDITEANGTFAVASNYPITSNSSTTPTVQEWNFDVTFINLDTDQGENAGKKMDAEIIIQQDELRTLADYVISQYTGVDGDNGIYYHDADLANSAGDNSYRYAGANPNNYVCFGSDASTCPSDNLYRIIGVFGSEVKLIKADYPTTSQTGTGGAYSNTYSGVGFSSGNYKGNQSLSSVGVYYWNPISNIWSSSSLTTTNLNTNFLDSLGPEYSNKIASHTWYVGGHTTNGATPKEFYNAESSGTTWSGKIGLMYVSDYGYAASNNYWRTNMNSYNSASGSNWMYMGLYEWTISRYSRYSDYAFFVYDTGYVYYYYGINHAVRPSFYLNSDVTYVSGDGSKNSPIIVN